jgi:hypothetical protein
MTRGEQQKRPPLWLLVLFVPLIALPVGALFVVTGGDDGRGLPIAQGAAGAFHPVAGDFVADSTKISDCVGSYTCLEQAFGNIAFADGPKRALAVYQAELTRNKDVERNCHRIVHTIGSATYARYDGDVARTFAEGSSECASGYYHGILERAFVGITSKAALGEAARELCLGVGIRRRSFLDYQCRHGLGHGFMIQTGYDLPTALSLCSGLGTGWDRVTCTSGSFMENVSTRFGYRSSWLDAEDPLYPCNRVAARHRRSCYVRATTWILQVEKNDFRRTANRCAEAGHWAAVCFRGFGRDAVVDARYRDFRKVRELCRLSGRYADDCYFGAARTFADGEGLAGARRAARFCATSPPGQRLVCAGGYGVIVGLVFATPEDRRAACADIAGRYENACAAAAEAEVDPSGRGAWG